jgi:hypothetical protein
LLNTTDLPFDSNKKQDWHYFLIKNVSSHFLQYVLGSFLVWKVVDTKNTKPCLCISIYFGLE